MDFPKIHHDIVDHSIMIGGLYRSGTTLLGKLVGSFKNAEYVFEPPMVLHLDYLVQGGSIEPKLAADLLRTNLAEDYFINFLHGRRFNMRPGDDSSVFVTKSYAESVGRWLTVPRLTDAVALFRSDHFRLVFKSAAKYALWPVLLDNYRHLKIIEITRDLRSVLSSLLGRGWLSDRAVRDAEYGAVWPYAAGSPGYKIPYVGARSQIANYATANEQTRAVDFINAKMQYRFEVIRQIESHHMASLYRVKYEDLLTDAHSVIRGLSAFCQMDLSSRTEELVKTVRKTQPAHDIEEILDACDANLAKKFHDTNRLLGYT